MLDLSRRWRLFLLAVTCLGAVTARAQSPVLTTVSDTVYRADGSPASGTLLISWPAFTTADGYAVAAGTKSVALLPGGAFTTQLAPNVGSTPAGIVYTVVYQLSDGMVKSESWAVSTTSPQTIAQVRTILGTGAAAGQLATQQYVNSALANVVHLAGSETITGTKQFATAPVVPSPTQPGQAVNKAYVDASVINSGGGTGGNFVLKSGDTMTGPLVLPANPTAPLQAAPKQYVDLATAGKADLIGGVVPPSELGSGIANNSSCLHGDSTWSGCGSSPGTQAIKYATDFDWSQANTADLSSPGLKTVTLASCPGGVTGSEPQYYIYVSAAGTPEAVKVTGGTCAGDGQGGTLQFTTANSHPTGYRIGSASAGLQEALIAARYMPTNPLAISQSGKVIVPPGEIKAYATVSIRSSNIVVDFSGSIIECWTNTSCIFVGDSAISTAYYDITLVNPRGRPTVSGGLKPFIEVNAQKTRIFNVSTRTPVSTGTFGSYVQIDDDQAFLLDGLDTAVGQGLRCDATACVPAVYAPGPFNVYSAVGWLKNMNISLQCGGNGVDWESGNSLRITDSVIQGYAQYGVRGGTRRGGYAGMSLENVYEEVGGCTNPAGNIGQAGVIVQGRSVVYNGGVGPAGNTPQFANNGTNDYRYYVIANNAIGSSNPLYAGSALSNGTSSITVTTPDIAGATTLDLLRVTPVVMEQAPYGTGSFAVATNVSRASACSNGVCTFTDTQAPLQTYTVPTATYFPLLTYWPASIVLGAASDSGSPLAGARAWLQNMTGGIAAVSGTAQPSAFSINCDALGYWTPIWLSCFSAMAPQSFHAQGAMLMAVKPNADANGTLNLKGRLNFTTLGSGPGHIITLSDSNFQKTIATQNNRPTNDPNDSFIGYDRGDGNPAHIGVSFGAPLSLSNYVGNVGDGSSWLERLTSTLKEFKTNVQVDQGLTVLGSIQANSFISTGSGPWNLQGSFGTLTQAPAGQSLIGFGTNGKLQVSENGAALQEVAKLDSSGNNIATGLALSQIPTQCTGSFATGIQANGNANCSTASQIQLAETSQPTGVPNYGIFWFDSTCHCPKVISNNGQPVQLGLTNIFNQDSNGTNPANTLEQVNGTNPQSFRLYRAWTNATDWERTGISWDSTNQLFVWKNEVMGADYTTAHGLGFAIGSAVRWMIDNSANTNFKPITDNLYSIGTATLRPANGYFGTALYSPALLLQGSANTSGGPVNVNTQTAAIGTTNMLTGATVGQYEISVYLESDTNCTTPGSAAVSVTLGWGDRTGSRTMTVPLQGSGVSNGAVSLGSTANFGQGVVTVWNNSASNNLTYSTNYTGCTTGTGTYALYVTYRRMQ